MSGPSSYARRHYESAKEQEIRSLIKAISISRCGKVLGEVMNKTKGPGKAAPSQGFSQIKKSIQPGQMISEGVQRSLGSSLHNSAPFTDQFS